jgi:uncharacterized membrane protein
MLARDQGDADNRVLTARVRERLGRAVSHPGAIVVMAYNGHVRLAGDVLAHEREALLQTVRVVPGVHEVEDRLDAHETATGVPSLQGRGKAREQQNAMRVTPAAGMGMLAGGSLLGLFALMRRGSPRLLLTAAGVALVTGGLRGGRLGSRTSMQAGGQAIDVHKSIHVNAPCEQVFDLWSRYETFPRFMSNIKEVRDLGNGRSHWVVSGPAGATVEWDAITTESRRPDMLSWQSEPNASVQTSGSVRFRPDGDGTRVSVHLRYSPPGGAVGHALAAMFAKDPKQQMDEDLLRMKSFIESGRPPGDAARPSAGQTPAILR